MTNPRPRVLMIVDTFPGSANSPDYSGAANQLRALAPRLQAGGVEVRVLTSHVARHDAEDEVDGIRVFRLATGDRARFQRFAQRVAAWMLKHRGEWDIVHIHGMARSALAALAAARMLRKQSVLKFTLMGNDDPLTVKASRLGGLKMRLLGLADAYAAPSTALAESVGAAGLPSGRVAHIPNGVDLTRFSPAAEEERSALRKELLARFEWPADALVGLFVGAVEARKGIGLLARAWPEVVRRVPQARLLLVGPNDSARAETAKQFEEALRAAGVAKTAAVAGRTDSPEAYYKAADLFVFPSTGEGLPNALIEAQAAGLPSVATAISGVTEDVVDDGNSGVIVPQDDAERFSGAVVSLLQDNARRRRMGVAARTRAEAVFSIENVARQYVELYEKLLAQ